jgi:hypothetical protein
MSVTIPDGETLLVGNVDSHDNYTNRQVSATSSSSVRIARRSQEDGNRETWLISAGLVEDRVMITSKKYPGSSLAEFVNNDDEYQANLQDNALVEYWFDLEDCGVDGQGNQLFLIKTTESSSNYHGQNNPYYLTMPDPRGGKDITFEKLITPKPPKQKFKFTKVPPFDDKKRKKNKKDRKGK